MGGEDRGRKEKGETRRQKQKELWKIYILRYPFRYIANNFSN